MLGKLKSDWKYERERQTVSDKAWVKGKSFKCTGKRYRIKGVKSHGCVRKAWECIKW